MQALASLLIKKRLTMRQFGGVQKKKRSPSNKKGVAKKGTAKKKGAGKNGTEAQESQHLISMGRQLSGDEEHAQGPNDPNSIAVQGLSKHNAAGARTNIPTTKLPDDSGVMKGNHGAMLAPSEPVVPGRSGSSRSPVSINSARSASPYSSEFREAADAADAADAVANEMTGVPFDDGIWSAVAAKASPIDKILENIRISPPVFPVPRRPAPTSASITDTELDDTLLAREGSESRLPSPDERIPESLGLPASSIGGGSPGDYQLPPYSRDNTTPYPLQTADEVFKDPET